MSHFFRWPPNRLLGLKKKRKNKKKRKLIFLIKSSSVCVDSGKQEPLNRVGLPASCVPLSQSQEEQAFCLCRSPSFCVCVCRTFRRADRNQRVGGRWIVLIRMFVSYNIFLGRRRCRRRCSFGRRLGARPYLTADPSSRHLSAKQSAAWHGPFWYSV